MPDLKTKQRCKKQYGLRKGTRSQILRTFLFVFLSTCSSIFGTGIPYQSEYDSTLFKEPLSTVVRNTTITDLDPFLIGHIVSPTSGLNSHSAFSFLTSSHTAFAALPLSLQVSFYYFANRHLGLNASRKNSSVSAYRNCMFLSRNERRMMARAVSITLRKATISFCAAMIGNIAHGTWRTDFPYDTFDPIPIALQVQVAFRSLEAGNINYLLCVIRPVPDYVQQAFQFEIVRLHIFQAFIDGKFEKETSQLSLKHEGNHSQNAFHPDIDRIPQKVVAISYAENSALIRAWNIIHHGNKQMWIQYEYILRMMKHQIRDLDKAALEYNSLLSEFYHLLNRCVDSPSDFPAGMNAASFTQTLRDLLSRGLDINCLDRDADLREFGNPILRLATTGKRDVIAILASHGLKTNFIQDTVDLLLCAVNWSKLPLIEYLLEIGANPRTTYSCGSSILHLAIQDDESPVEVLKMLIKYGASPSYVSNEWMPVHRAVFFGNIKAVDYLLHDLDPMNDPVKRGLLDLEKLFFTACGSALPGKILPYFLGGYAGEGTWFGSECIRRLKLNHHDEFAEEVKRMEKMHQSRSVTDNSTFFARTCILSGDLRLLEVMLSRGANIDEMDAESGFTCILYAITHQKMSMFTFLLSLGVDIKAGKIDRAYWGGDMPWWRKLRGQRPQMRRRFEHPLIAAVVAGLPWVKRLITEAQIRQQKFEAAVIKLAMVAASRFHDRSVFEYLSLYLAGGAIAPPSGIEAEIS